MEVAFGMLTHLIEGIAIGWVGAYTNTLWPRRGEQWKAKKRHDSFSN
jgi:hypothetical protein